MSDEPPAGAKTNGTKTADAKGLGALWAQTEQIRSEQRTQAQQLLVITALCIGLCGAVLVVNHRLGKVTS